MEFLGHAALDLAIAAAVVGALGLCGAFSTRVDAFTHLAPLTAAAALVAFVAALATGGWLAAGLAVAGLAGASWLMAPELSALAGARAGAGDGARLTIIQFNIWWINRRPAETIAWLRRQEADVLVLQETIGPSAPIVEALADLYPHRAPARGGPQCSTLILSRAPMREAGIFPSSARGRPHHQAWARFGDGESAFAVAGVHLGWPIPARTQQAQIQRLVAALAEFDPGSLVLAGDFNSTPWSFTLRRLDRRLGLARRTLALATWPARRNPYLPLVPPFPLFAIDHVYAGAAWTTASVTRGPRLGSDHFPVTVVLSRGRPG